MVLFKKTLILFNLTTIILQIISVAQCSEPSLREWSESAKIVTKPTNWYSTKNTFSQNFELLMAMPWVFPVQIAM